MSRAIEAIMPEEQGDAKDWAWMWGSSFVLLWASCAFVQLYLHAMRMAGCL